MDSARCIIVLFIFWIMLFAAIQTASGIPASSFALKDGEWYDNFGINRNYYAGPDGYLPNLAYETLEENRELAYSIGEKFRDAYPSKIERATAILKYVQTWTDYGYDSDNVVMNGEPQEEWAWNADEMAHRFDEARGIKAIGDCEDMAFLCGTIYVGAGFDAAIVDAPMHVALLIWLPEFSNANKYWDLQNDGRGAGWIWVEATGESNPLGWTPPDFQDGEWIAYPIGPSDFAPGPPEGYDTSDDSDESWQCIILTATYGSPLAEEVVFMRHVRDDLIGSTVTGRQLVNAWNTFYYAWSPSLAQAIAHSNPAKSIFRVILTPLFWAMHTIAIQYHCLAWINPELAAITAFTTAATTAVTIYILIPTITIAKIIKIIARKRKTRLQDFRRMRNS